MTNGHILDDAMNNDGRYHVDVTIPPELATNLMEYTLAMESETYAEYIMKRDLMGMPNDEYKYDEDEFSNAHKEPWEMVRS